MRRAWLTLVLPLLLAGPASAGEAEESEDRAASAASGANLSPQRGPLLAALAGVLGQGGNGEGFKSGSDLGLALGYRFGPHWSLALDLSWQRGEGGPDITESGLRARRAFRRGGVQPYLQAGVTGYFYDRPVTPIVIVNGVPMAWRPAKSLTNAGFTLGAGVETPVARRFSVGAGVSYYFVVEELSYGGGNAMDYYSVGLTLTFAPRGTGWR